MGEILVEEYHSHRGGYEQQAGRRQERQVPEDKRADYRIKSWSLLGRKSPWKRGRSVSLGTRLKERLLE